MCSLQQKSFCTWTVCNSLWFSLFLEIFSLLHSMALSFCSLYWVTHMRKNSIMEGITQWKSFPRWPNYLANVLVSARLMGPYANLCSVFLLWKEQPEVSLVLIKWFPQINPLLSAHYFLPTSFPRFHWQVLCVTVTYLLIWLVLINISIFSLKD